MQGKSKTWLTLLTTVLLASLFLLPSAIASPQPKTIAVPDDYSDIQTAINHAVDGDTVFVRAGTYSYNEQNSIIARPHSGTPNYGIIVNKSISLIGENRNTILSIDGSYGVFVAVCIDANDVTFSGFTIKNFSRSSVYSQIGGVGILGSNCKIVNNVFQLYVSGIGNNQNISNNTFEGAGLGFQFSNSTITNNRFSNGDGIGISSSSNVIIKGNHIEYADRGIHLRNVNQNVNTNISIYQNDITNNLRFGIELVGGTSDSLIFNNNITNNGVGINLSNFALRKETSIGSGTKIFSNNLIDNTQNAYVEKEYPFNLTFDMSYNRVTGNATTVVIWYNGDVGNYWSDYDGSGLYAIDQNNVDRHPQTHPVDTSTEVSMPNSFLAESWIQPLIVGVVVIVVGMISFLVYRRHRKTANLQE